MNKVMTTLLSAAVATSMCQAAEPDGVIEKPDFNAEAGAPFSIDAMMALGRVTNPQVSPDGKKVLFGLSYESIEQNKSNNDLYIADLKTKEISRLTRTEKSEGNATWIENGKRIAFTYPDKEGKAQLNVMDVDGNHRQQVTEIAEGIEGFLFSPDCQRIILISTVKYSQDAADIYPDLPKATGRVIDDLMYKHWDEWVTRIPHPFIATWNGNKIEGLEDILGDDLYESPMRPWGGIESFSWAPDSKSLIYVSRKKKGVEYAISTNSDLYLYDILSKQTRNLTEGMKGYDTNPRFSPDGKKVAWLSMERDGYEADKNRVMIMDMLNGTKTDLTANWDYSAEEMEWEPGGKFLYIVAAQNGTKPVFKIDAKNGKVSEVAAGVADYNSLQPMKSGVLMLRHSMLYPNEICEAEKGKVTAVTEVNKDILSQLKMPTVKKEVIPAVDGKPITTWVVYPGDFDSTKTYPAILFCQGGPQDAVSQFWSYRWNFALMAANGYIIVAPNRRGLPGFGTKWNEAISGDYPGLDMQDYLSAVDYMKKYPYVDGKHFGATGASYGGFSIYWLAGNHDKRFAALLAHAGIFNTEAQYLETEEMWFANWDMGGAFIDNGSGEQQRTQGAFWNKENPVAQRTHAMSPHRFVDKWDTPIMVSHGELDYRILSSQGQMAFNAAKLRGIPAEMVLFPDENHWILQPQNAVLWQRLFFRWFDKWLKPAQ